MSLHFLKPEALLLGVSHLQKIIPIVSVKKSWLLFNGASPHL